MLHTINSLSESLFRVLNTALYEALGVMLAQHGNNKESGLNCLRYSENQYGELGDLLDELSVNYFDNTPDGDYAVEMKAKRIADNSPMFTDVQAYGEMLSMFNSIKPY